MNLLWLSGEIGSGAGDVAGGADFRPTDASLQVLATIEKDLAAARGGLRDAHREGRAGVQQGESEARDPVGRARTPYALRRTPYVSRRCHECYTGFPGQA